MTSVPVSRLQLHRRVRRQALGQGLLLGGPVTPTGRRRKPATDCGCINLAKTFADASTSSQSSGEYGAKHIRSSDCVWRRSVKPSAQPTLVRTQHLPPSAKTARWLRKRGPAGRLVLVTPCIRVCHRGSMRSSGYGHIADSVRAERAVRITAPFADPRPFCPVARAPDSRLTGVCAAFRSSGFSPFCSRQVAGWPYSYLRPGSAGRSGPGRACGDRPAPSYRGSTEGMTGCA